MCISDNVLHGIIEELYYPQSPYTFAVVETEVLGEIYEQFLGEVITDLTDILDQADRDYCMAAWGSSVSMMAVDVCGAGGRYPSDECGRTVLYRLRHCSMRIRASFRL